VDTNSDPTNIDFVIPANDDAAQSISLIVGVMVDAIKEGLSERKVEKNDTEPTNQNDGEKSVQKTKKGEVRARLKARKAEATQEDDAKSSKSKKSVEHNAEETANQGTEGEVSTTHDAETEVPETEAKSKRRRIKKASDLADAAGSTENKEQE